MKYTMRWLLIIVLLVSDTAGVEERRKDYSNQSLVSVTVKNKCDLKYLQQLIKENKENVIELWNEAINEKVLMRVPCIRLDLFESQLKNRNMIYKIVAPDLQKLLLRESEEFEASGGEMLLRSSGNSKNFFNTYHSVESIVKFLKSFTRRNADMSQLQTIGYSFEKRPLFAVKISTNSRKSKTGSNQRNSKKMILIDCGCHAREWATINFCLYFMDRLISDYKEGKAITKKILEKYDFTIVPILNPDGYKYTQTVDRLWRKNRAKNPDSKCYGVDLNRNFDVAFEKCNASDACLEDYCGHEPFSEPETRSINRILKKNKGRIKATFNIHTYSQLWLLPWSKTSDSLPKNYDKMVEAAKVGVEAIRQRYGSEFVIGRTSKLLYESAGTALDYACEKGFAEYCYALELRDTGEFGFLLPKEQIPQLNEETTDGLLAAISAMT